MVPQADRIAPNEIIRIRSRIHTQDWVWYHGMIRGWIRGEQVPPPPTSGSSLSLPTLPDLGYLIEQAFATTMDRELRHMRDAVRAIIGKLEREHNMAAKMRKLTARLEMAGARVGVAEARTAAAEAVAAHVAVEQAPEE
ncbi:hypothetical protein E3N88_20028 [Mikania micrantha]|uniref:SMARCC C-terminal domain-containing protein n=1 Tax=Mikania micrantha TaxID=192012 RepID=A0A5N6NIG2_9ASTR|nr:hypothetical protein E3N88_20028 [Mikania micrantha]